MSALDRNIFLMSQTDLQSNQQFTRRWCRTLLLCTNVMGKCQNYRTNRSNWPY